MMAAKPRQAYGGRKFKALKTSSNAAQAAIRNRRISREMPTEKPRIGQMRSRVALIKVVGTRKNASGVLRSRC